MGILNSLGNFAWGCQIPCLVGDTKNTEVVPKSLGDLTLGEGGRLGGGSAMTLGTQGPGTRGPEDRQPEDPDS